ncbi:MAG: hypothetical protein IPF64_08695 [Flavobacteriales bacterium]|nr:hypothetical protein [Flavobacteriales bacterium]
MSLMIDHAFLDVYEAAAGDPDRVSAENNGLVGAAWTIADELLQDLHMIKFGYTTEGYDRHVERRLKEVCADESVVERLKGLRL